MVGKVTSNEKASASILPAIMGYSRYESRNEALQKVAAALAGNIQSWDGNEATRWGNNLEPTVLAEMAKRLSIEHNPSIDYAMVHPSLPLEASLDAIGFGLGQTVKTDPDRGIFVMNENGSIVLEGNGCLESKVTSVRPEDRPDLARGPLQLQAQMMCAGHHWGAIGVLYQGICLRVFVFEEHSQTRQAITAAVIDFNKRVHSSPIKFYEINDSADACLIYPEIDQTAEPLALDHSYQKLCEEHILLKTTIADAHAALELIGVEIQKGMGNHAKAELGDYKISWPMKNFKARPEKVVPAKDAYSMRQSTITVKERA